MSKVKFSIITSCFNSTNTLHRTYVSLLKQKYTNFEWILVDDASTDEGKTRELILSIYSENRINIKYIFLEKNTFASGTIYKGCLVAEGSYMMVLDHDDQLTPNALSVVEKYIDICNKKSKIYGIAGRCYDENHNLIGKKFKEHFFIANEGEVRFKYKITSELAVFAKLEIVTPIFKEMKPGYTFGYVWVKLSTKYDCIYTNEALRVYDTALPTSYTNSKTMTVSYPAGKAENLKSIILSYRPYLIYNFIYASRFIASYLRHIINSNQSVLYSIKDFDLPLKIWCVLLIPLAYIYSNSKIYQIIYPKIK